MKRIACQTIIFGNETNLEKMDYVMETVAGAGYSGIEIGAARFHMEKPEYYKGLLEKYALKLVAIHTGGNFLDRESVKKQMENFPRIAGFAKFLGCSNIFLSGGYESELTYDSYAQLSETYNNMGRLLHEEGMILSYHNHDWEFRNNQVGFNTLVELTDPKYLSFIPDVGWITRSGNDPLDILPWIKGRMTGVHFKEFTADGQFAEIGRGIVNFGGVYELIRNDGIWIIAEQDQFQGGLEENVKNNYNYINSL